MMENFSEPACFVEVSALKTYWKSPVAAGLLLFLCMFSAKNSITQEERMATSPLLVTKAPPGVRDSSEVACALN